MNNGGCNCQDKERRRVERRGEGKKEYPEILLSRRIMKTRKKSFDISHPGISPGFSLNPSTPE
jgi:hypothetical protein